MLNGIYYNPTKILFGKGMESHIGEEVAKCSKKILLHYGGGTIKKIGLYDKIIQSLEQHGVEYIELPGVKPNPRAEMVYRGIDICRKESIDFILAVGGGSVIDSAKVIAIGVPYGGDFFDFTKGANPSSSIKVGTILTVPGSGSESSPAAVITHEDRCVKFSYYSTYMTPVFSILNPEVTFSLNKVQTSAGIVDAISHVFERYFSNTEFVDCSDKICEGLMKTLMKYAVLIKDDPKNYDIRAEIMWACKLAHDDTAGFGRKQDWACHSIAHEIAAIYDTVHGATLAVIFPAWMKYVFRQKKEKFLQFADRVMDIKNGNNSEETILKAIQKFQDFLKHIGMPTNMKEHGIHDMVNYETIAKNSVQYMQSGTIGNFIRLSSDDVNKILQIARR